MQDHPISAVFTAWLRSWRSGACSLGQVLNALENFTSKTFSQAYEHIVVFHNSTPIELPPSIEKISITLKTVLMKLTGVTNEEIQLTLPTPGNPSSIAKPGLFSKAALEAGQGIRYGQVGLVPEVISDRMVRWHAYPATPLLSAPVTVAQAREELLLAATEVTNELTRLDVQSWRQQLATELHTLRNGQRLTWLPYSYSAAAGKLISQAGAINAIVNLATTDPSGGGTINSQQAFMRSNALRQIAGVARHAYCVGINAPLNNIDPR